jgi:hypothetical protein
MTATSWCFSASPARQTAPVLLSLFDLQIEPEEARDTLMEKCSTNGTPPHQSSAPSATSGGTI